MTTTMTRLSAAACVLTAVTAVTLTPSPPAAQVVRIVQTNSAGDNVHLIDPATNMIVGEITGVEVVHGVAAAPDGSRLYLSNESTETLDIVDARTLAVTKRGGPRNSDSLLRWDPDQGEGVWNATEATELSC